MIGSAKILIVDDEPVGRELLEAILITEGYQLSFAVDGAEAIDMALKDLPDIILLDVMMPKIDGFEVCRNLHGNNLTAHIPIYMITALDDRDSRIRGIDAGAHDYISKPFDRVEVLAKIKNITNKISALKKGLNVMNREPGMDQPVSVADNLLPVLMQIQLETEEEPEEFFIFRSVKAIESAHACFRSNSALGQYTIMVSNKLNGIHAAVVNSIFKSILLKTIQKFDGKPWEIIRMGLSGFHDLVTSNILTVIPDPISDVLIIFHNRSSKTVSVAGLNQTILFYAPVTAENRTPVYESFHISADQDFQLRKVKHVVACSHTAYETIDPEKILSTLNTSVIQNDYPDIEKLAKEKFHAIRDLVLIGLTFF